MEQLVSVFVNNGVAVGVVAYFIWKDAKLTKENTEILNQVKAMLELIYGKHITKEIKENNNENIRYNQEKKR